MRHRRHHPVLVLLAVVALLATACSGDGDDEPEPSTTTEAAGAPAEGRIQDLWVLSRLRTVHDGELVDLTPGLAEAAEDAGEPVPLVDGVTIADVPGLTVDLVDADGEPRDDVDVAVGWLDAGADPAIVALATPQPDAPAVQWDDELQLSLDPVADDVTDGAALITDYLFAQTMPSDDAEVAGAEAELVSLDLLAARLERKALRYLSLDGGGAPLGYLAQIGTITVPGADADATEDDVEPPDAGDDEGALGPATPEVRLASAAQDDGGDDPGGPIGGIPPKAQPTIGGFAKGIWECRGKAFGTLGCLDDFFDTFGDGIEDSLDQIDDQLGGPPGPPEDPPDPPCTGSCGGSSGEPHLRTFDGDRYDLQTAGELVAARTDGLEVQVRTEPYGDSRLVSVNTAVAVGTADHRITLTLADEDEPVRIDGEVVALDDLRGEGRTLGDGTEVAVRLTSLQVRSEAGDLVTAYGLGGSRLDVYVDDAGEDGGWEGLFGDGDGTAGSDLVPQGGDEAVDPDDTEALYGDFADSWRVTDETSLFDYADGEDTETFTDLTFPDERATLAGLDPTQRGIAELVCEAAAIVDPASYDDCVLDYALTGEADFVVGAQVGDAVQQLSDGRLVPGELVTAIVDVATGGMTWTWTDPGRELTEIGGGELATGEGIVVVRTRDDDGASFMTAFDLDDGTERWEVPDVATDCRPVVTANGVVAHLDANADSAGEDPNADLVLYDLETGEERSRWQAAEDADHIDRCEAALSATEDGTVISVDRRRVVRALSTTDGTLALTWSLPVDGDDRAAGWAPVVGGAPYLVVRSEATDALAVWRLDVTTGEVTDRLDIPELRTYVGRPASLEPLPGDRLAVVGDPANGETPVLVVLDTTDELAVAWTYEFTEDAELTRAPSQVSGADGLVAGWSDSPDDGGVIAAWDLETGELAWTVVPSSFDNSGGEIEGADGVGFLVSPFGGNWLEALADGEEVWSIEAVGGFEDPLALGPVTDEGVVLAGPISGDAGGGTWLGVVDVDR